MTTPPLMLRTLGGFLLVAAAVAGLPGPSARAGSPAQLQQCGTTSLPILHQPSSETGGIYLPASGVLRVLMVFVSFPDDDTPHPWWPARQPPLLIDQFLDPDTLRRSPFAHNLTKYLRQMSLGRFHVIGDVLWVETARSQAEYGNGSYGRANTDVLVERVDSLVDFSRYDAWTRLADYQHANTPDGVVDMLIMVWRTTIFGYLGEASLGYKPAIAADGVRIEMGYPAFLPQPHGSGITCSYPYGDTPAKLLRTMVHEMSHWLLGIPHPYNGLKPDGKHQFWGMLCAGERLSSCANAYDRERLGWISVPELQPGDDVRLRDFVTTGDAVKYHPPEGDPFEFFYFENHQLLSVFDDITANRDDKGIWVLHQQGPYAEADNLRILPSDGLWDWEREATEVSCFGTEIPVFGKKAPNVKGGYSHRDQIPSPQSIVEWMFAFRDQTGGVSCGAFLHGERFEGSFTPDRQRVFSLYSDPATHTWSGVPTALAVEVKSVQDGTATLMFHASSHAAPPARRHLGIHPTASSPSPGSLILAWGSEWEDGPALEADVVESELERDIGNSMAWERVYRGPATSWADTVNRYDTAGTVEVAFRVRVRDAEGDLSTWSEAFWTRTHGFTPVAPHQAQPMGIPSATALERNYPNPFNPSTTIRFSIGLDASGEHSGELGAPKGVGGPAPVGVRLAVYDILGREVAELLSTRMAAGRYEAVWNAAGQASGVYVCRLTAGGTSVAHTMLLAR